MVIVGGKAVPAVSDPHVPLVLDQPLTRQLLPDAGLGEKQSCILEPGPSGGGPSVPEQGYLRIVPESRKGWRATSSRDMAAGSEMASPATDRKTPVPGASAEDEGEGRLLRDPAAGTELHGLHGIDRAHSVVRQGGGAEIVHPSQERDPPPGEEKAGPSRKRRSGPPPDGQTDTDGPGHKILRCSGRRVRCPPPAEPAWRPLPPNKSPWTSPGRQRCIPLRGCTGCGRPSRGHCLRPPGPAGRQEASAMSFRPG